MQRNRQYGSFIFCLLLLTTLSIFVFTCLYRQILYRQFKFKNCAIAAEKWALWTCHQALLQLSQKATLDTIASYCDIQEPLPLVQFYNTLSYNNLQPIVSKGTTCLPVYLTKEKCIELPLEFKSKHVCIAYGVFEDTPAHDSLDKIPICCTQYQGLRLPFNQAIQNSKPSIFSYAPEIWVQSQQRFRDLENPSHDLTTSHGFLPVVRYLQMELSDNTITVNTQWWNPYDRKLTGPLNCQLDFTSFSNAKKENYYESQQFPIQLHLNPGTVYETSFSLNLQGITESSIIINDLTLKTSAALDQYINIISNNTLSLPFKLTWTLNKIADFQATNLWPSHTTMAPVQTIANYGSPSHAASTPPWKTKKVKSIVTATSAQPQHASLWSMNQNVTNFTPKIIYYTQTPFERIQACFVKTQLETPYAAVGWPYLASTHNHYNEFYWDNCHHYNNTDSPPININLTNSNTLTAFESAFKALGYNCRNAATFVQLLQKQIAQKRPFFSINAFVQSGVLQESLKDIQMPHCVRQSDLLACLSSPLAVRSEAFVILGAVVVNKHGTEFKKTCKMHVHREALNATKRKWVIDGITWH